MVDKKLSMEGLGMMAIGILTLILIYGIIPLVGSSLDTAASIPENAYASGAFVFTGNVSNGELVNITDGTAVYRFEFNTTNAGNPIVCKTTNCIAVNLSGVSNYYFNQSWLASGNLTDAINNNASVALLVAAVNTTNRTTITAETVGVGANAIALSDNVANGAWSHNTMTGGVTAGAWASSNIPTGASTWATLSPFLTLSAILVMVFGFLRLLKGAKNSD